MRGPSAERRSFIAEHAGDLWVGDAMHGPLVIAPDGQVRKSYLLSQIDDATRYILHSYSTCAIGGLSSSGCSSTVCSATAIAPLPCWARWRPAQVAR